MHGLSMTMTIVIMTNMVKSGDVNELNVFRTRQTRVQFAQFLRRPPSDRFVASPRRRNSDSEKRLRRKPPTDSSPKWIREPSEKFTYPTLRLFRWMQLRGRGGGEIKRRACHRADGSGRKVTLTPRLPARARGGCRARWIKMKTKL
ncbi:hypothetical protein CEXT_475341 [Caerostris extrusa]|uniref:Uncharacterized protein n=1 Tax=Caerostris extrusa TaxID=172846 RepID=A0AAV4TE39_CAEEX|nr:hypothetical protein CEXT_475341 [Caerostris extrusa]